MGVARQVLKNGSIELIAAVDAGALKISVAARLAGLPKEEQAKALKKGAKRARSKPDTPGPGYCGRLPQEGGEDTLAFLWVTAAGLRTALRALRASGFLDGKTKTNGVIKVEW